MKKIVLLAFIAIFAINLQAKDWDHIRIATEGAFPPFNSTDKDGNVIGLEIDFIHELCSTLKVRCTIVTQDWDGIIPGLLAKKYDAIIASLSITNERKRSIAFSKAYYTTGSSFIAKKGMYDDTSPESLVGRNIGFQKASISENFIMDLYKKSNTKSYVKVEDAFLDLSAGRLDLVFNDTLSSVNSFLKTEDGKDFAINGEEYFDVKYFGTGIGVGLRKADKELKALFDKGIDILYDNGMFVEISERWIPGVDITVKN